jgi:hypothetical protein
LVINTVAPSLVIVIYYPMEERVQIAKVNTAARKLKLDNFLGKSESEPHIQKMIWKRRKRMKNLMNK